MKPTTPYDDRPGDASRDEAKGGYSLYALERMLRDCGDQPLQWRPRGDLCCAYYDGKQLSPAMRAMVQAENLDERCTNLVRPVINSVLGQEAKSRTDIKLESDDDAFQDVVDALAPKLKEAERETNAHMAVSNGYASMVKAGLGWVEVARNADPLSYAYRVEDIGREEIWWDWRGQKGNTMNRARWLVRMRWIDLDEIEAAMPQHREVLRAVVNGWDSLILDDKWLNEPEARLAFAHEQERRFNVSRRDWVDSARKQVKVYEVWYRVPAEVVVLHLGPTKRVAYDENDPRHVEAVARGLVKVSKGITSQVRMALYAGPHRLSDQGTTRRRFPYVPFFAFRDDEDGSPYGLIDGMISPQDEYNERRLRIQWMLKAKQIDIDNDALDETYNSIADVAANAMRPDMVTVLRADRRHPNGITRRNELALQPEQVMVMQDAKQLIQDTSGRYVNQLGQQSKGVTSGIANSILVDQGEQSMGEMNDNYTFARRSVFELLVDLIAEDHSGAELEVLVGTGASKRKVYLNGWDPQTGMPVNHVKDADVKVGLGEVPSSPAFRMQQQQQIATIVGALGNNPAAVNILAPSFVESSSLENRKQVADDLRRATGQPLPEDRAGMEQAQQAQAQAQQEAQALAKQMAAAELATKAADAAQRQAQARKTMAEAVQLEQSVQAAAALAEQQARTAKTQTAAQLDAARIAEIGQRMDAAARQPDDQSQAVDEALQEALA